MWEDFRKNEENIYFYFIFPQVMCNFSDLVIIDNMTRVDEVLNCLSLYKIRIDLLCFLNHRISLCFFFIVITS